MNPLNPADVVFAIWTPGGGELLLILAIVLIIFGHNRIPQLGEALGKGIQNFKKSFSKDEADTKGGANNAAPIAESRPAADVTTVQADSVKTTPVNDESNQG